MEGKLAIVATILTMTSIFIYSRPKTSQYQLFIENNYLPFIPLIFFVIVHIAGYGDVNHLAATNSKAGHLKWHEGDKATAIDYFRIAVKYSPRHAAGRITLAKALAQTGNLKEAIMSADQAVATCRFEHSWDTIFEILDIAGSLRLKSRTPQDLEIANDYFTKAEKMWRQNSRLSLEKTSSILYNLACLKAIYNKDMLETGIYLLEALAIDLSLKEPRLIFNVANDPDLSILELDIQRPLEQEKITIFMESDPTAPVFREMINNGKVTVDDLIRFLALIIKVSLEHN